MLCEELTVAHYVAFKMFSPVERAQANALENLISLCRPCHTAFDHQQGVRVSVGGG
jgi:5-methylcytosine-specific restriction endonuclease McrA